MSVTARSCLKAVLLSTIATTTLMATDVDADLKSVLLYQDSAKLTFTGSLSWPAGRSKHVMTGLPDELDEDRLRLWAAAAGVRISGLELNEDYIDVAQDPRRQALQDQFDALVNAYGLLQAELNAIEVQKTLIVNAAKTTGEGLTTLPSVEALQARMKFVAEQSRKLASDEQGIKKAMTENRTRQSEIRRQMAAITGKRLKKVSLAFTIDAGAAGSGQLTLQGSTEEAGWEPVLDARFNSGNSQLLIETSALIWQETGGNWEGADITLSTGEEPDVTEPDDWTPGFLEIYDPRVMLREVQSMAPAPAGKAYDAELEEILVAGNRSRETRITDFGAEYSLGQTFTIMDGADDVFVPLDAMTMNADTVIRAVTSGSGNAALYLTVTPGEMAPTIPGEVTLFRDGIEYGTVEWSTSLRSDQQSELFFGAIDGVKVTKQLTGGKGKNAGFFGSDRTRRIRHVITVENKLPRSAEIEVWDRLPVSRHKEIEVKVPRDATKPTKPAPSDQPGKLIWHKDVTSGQTWTINHYFDVSWPEDKQIAGPDID